MKKYMIYIGIIVFFSIIFFLSPISGDDWGNFLVGKTGLYHAVGNAVGLYFDWEGRFISRLFINILTYHKWIWNILNSLLIAGCIYFGMKIVGKQPKKIMLPLLILMFLFMNMYTFSQTITWLAGNMTYFFVIPVILWYFYYLLNNDEYNKFYMLVFICINLFATMFVEHMALVLICGNILLIVYKYIKNKTIDKRLVVYTVISIFSTLTMLLSPGTRARTLVENLEFNKLNIFEKVMYNVPNFIYFTFIVNSYMLVLMSYSNYLIIKEKISNRWLRCLLIVFVLVIPLFTIVIYPVSLFTLNKLDFLIDASNIFIIIYWLLYLVLSFVLLLIEDIKDFKNIFFFLIGVLANVVMLVSPVWGFRTSLFTYIALSIVALSIINKYISERKIMLNLAWTLTFIAALFYLVLYVNVYRCQKDLEKAIKVQLEEDSETIYIPRFPSFVNCNINPENDYHIAKYKEYYGIDSDKNIVLVDGKWKYLIIYEE